MPKTANSLLNHQLEALFKEYNMLTCELKIYYENIRRDTQMFFTIIGTLLGITFAKPGLINENVIYIMLPSTIFFFFLQEITNLRYVQIYSIARADVELKINALIGDQKTFEKIGGNLLNFESKFWPDHMYRSLEAGFIAKIVMIVFLIGLFVYFGFKSYKINRILFFLHCFQLIIIAFLCILWIKATVKERIEEKKEIK